MEKITREQFIKDVKTIADNRNMGFITDSEYFSQVANEWLNYNQDNEIPIMGPCSDLLAYSAQIQSCRDSIADAVINGERIDYDWITTVKENTKKCEYITDILLSVCF